jgi:hypothetical protein
VTFPPTSRRYAPKVLHKYLTRYAEADARAADDLGDYERALVVPVYREDPSFLDGYRAAFDRAAGRTLCVVVLNQPCDANAQDRETNAALLHALVGARTKPRSHLPPCFLASRPNHDLLVVARLDEPWAIARRKGVGLARKIGVDLATRAFWLGKLRSPWIFVTDADATLPTEYFATRATADSTALCLPFRHVRGASEDLYRATLAYEVQLRYRVLGLWHAGCRYAFHTVGSSLAVHAESYAAVRGFPRRAAGEDFHLLQKLAKLGPVEIPATAPILLASRTSDRVPFGTGPSAGRLLSGEPFVLDDPRAYDALGDALAGLLAGVNDAGDRRRVLDRSDGLACQQLLHRLRDEHFPKLPAREALARAPFVPAAAKLQSEGLIQVNEALLAAEARLPRLRGPTATEAPT